MAIASQYIRASVEVSFEAGESGILLSGPKFTTPELQVTVSYHTAQNITPTLQIEVAVS